MDETRSVGAGQVPRSVGPAVGPLRGSSTPDRMAGVVGRERELAVVRSALERASAGAGSLMVVTGEPGIGKTTLLREAERLADGFVCVWAHGVQGERPAGRAGLLELLSPLRELRDDVPPGQAAALGSALGWGPAAGGADPFLVSAGTMSLLARAAEQAPLLVLVDDLPWVDEESAQALLFAARRLGRDPVVVLASVTDPAEVPGGVSGLRLLRLDGLARGDAARLLGGRVTPGVADRLVQGTGGNPLALLEAVRGLTRGQRVGAEPLPDVLPTGAGLQGVFERTLGALSEPVRLAMLLIAVGNDADTATLMRAVAEAGVDAVAALDEARERGVAAGDGNRWVLRHPLLRSAVLRGAGPGERRDAHRAWAASLTGDPDGPRRLWHLAQATAGGDDTLADELARAAQVQRTRRGFAASSAMLERAAELTGDPEAAGRRRAGAVHDAFVAGDTDRVRALAGVVLASAPHDEVRAAVQYDLGTLEQYTGSVPRAEELLARAADTASGVLKVHVLAELALCRFRLGDIAGMGACADALEGCADREDPAQRLLADFTRGVTCTLAGDPAGQPLLTSVVDLAASPPLRDDPRHLLHLALAAGFLGDARHAMAVGAALLARARERGAIGILVPALALAAVARAWLGDHAGAFADAGEAVELGDLLGYTADVAAALETLAWQSACRGLHDNAATAVERARTLTDRAGTTSVAAHTAITAAFCALCRGDPAATADLLEVRMAVDGGIGAMGEPLGIAPLLVEAYLALGRASDAVHLASRYAEVTPPSAPAATQALVARCTALTAPTTTDAAQAFDQAIDAHARGLDTFEQARTRLLYGARLRRDGHRVRARHQLRAAHHAFDTAGLTLWAQRALDELNATGATARPRRPHDVEPLTSQETRVALLVAQGLSNREVAAALFLSPKTVEHHLSSVYRKRGFRSRTELTHRYATTPPDPSDPSPQAQPQRHPD
jgi:DNA-binding NarL/FixJ family response regulator